MPLILGSPASGKTGCLLNAIRRSLQQQDFSFRLLVPTATMAEHFRNLLVREGFILRPGLVLTFSKFLAAFSPPGSAASSATLRLLVEDILARLPLPAFAEVRAFPGFRDALSGVIEEFSAAGADAEALEAFLAAGTFDGPLAAPLAAVFRELERELAARGQSLRQQRLKQAAAVIRANGLPGIRHLYFDGFLSFPAPDLEVLAALAGQADLTITLPDWPGASHARAALRRIGLPEQVLPSRPLPARRVLVSAPTLEQEVEEICRRILAANRPFREIGILIRNPARYLPALHAALARFGIPSRSYIAGPLAAHPLVRYYSLLIESARTGWEHEPLIAALAMNLSGTGGTARGDRLNFQLRDQLPNRGLAALRTLDPEARLAKFIAGLDSLGDSLSGFAPASEWPRRLAPLPALLHIPRPGDAVSHEQALLWRAQPTALQAFQDALAETAAALGPDSLIDFNDFWQKARAVLELTALRVPDHRANVVHVLDAWEARQWNLPVMFVCGLLEGEFPAYPNEEPLVPDAVRARLASAGLLVKTLADRQREEEFLWQMALTRASEELVLTYPKFNDAGEAALPSFHLAGILASEETAVPVRPASPRSRSAVPPAVIHDDHLRLALATLHPRWKPTAIESFLQCPFQFFSRYTLRLASAPRKPEERLDRLAQGNLVHNVLAEWHRDGQPLEDVFDRLFEAWCREKRVREGYASEMARLEMLRNLQEFLRNPRLQPGWKVEVEQDFNMDLEPGVRISGRIDRYDVSPTGSVRLVDYKYSSAAGLSKRFQQPDADRYVQGGLYLVALSQHHKVESFHYCGLKGGAHWRGWDNPVEVRDLMEQARRLTLDTVRGVTAGDISIRPWSPDACQYCDYRDACRIKEVQAGQSARSVQTNP